MRYIPHQRSLPPLPISSQMSSQRWQSSSLPTRSRHRDRLETHRELSPISSYSRNWASSYFDYYNKKDDNYFNGYSSPTYFDHPRSASTHNLYDMPTYDSCYYPLNDHYSSDDLTALQLRSQLDSPVRRKYNRSSYDYDTYARNYGQDLYVNRKNFAQHSPYYRRLSPEVEQNYDAYSYHRSPYTSRSMNHLNKRSRNNSPERHRTQNGSHRRNKYYSNPDYGSLSISASLQNRASRSRDTPNFYNSRSQRKFQVPEVRPETDTAPTLTNHLTSSRFVVFKQSAPKHCTQILATLVVSLGPLCAGLGKGYSSPALASMASLSAQGQHFVITKDQGSWIASLSLLGAFFGSLPAGMSINFGRKKVIYIVSIPFAFSWILTVVASNIYMLYLAAFLGGICTAIISFVTPVYISEIAHPEIRGCLCAFSKLNSNVGMLMAYLLGAFLNWRKLALFTSFVPACLFVTAIFIPETPSFLLYRGRNTEATESLKWLRGSNADVSRELSVMKSNIEAFRRQQTNRYLMQVPPSRSLIRPLIITCGLMFFQKFSGANAFNFYAVPILSETFVGLNPYRAAVVVAFVQICAGLASSALVDTVGRRPLLVFSNMLMAAALAAFGFYVYFKGQSQNENLFSRHEWKESDWVPLFCILVIEIAYSLGVSPISWLYIGEIFPLKHRNYGALAAAISYVCSFASVKTFVDLQQWLGLYGAFWFYSTFAAFALTFTLIFVPETKGKSLQEMQIQEEHKETMI